MYIPRRLGAQSPNSNGANNGRQLAKLGLFVVDMPPRLCAVAELRNTP